jgi:hypothetical protein
MFQSEVFVVPHLIARQARQYTGRILNMSCKYFFYEDASELIPFAVLQLLLMTSRDMSSLMQEKKGFSYIGLA